MREATAAATHASPTRAAPPRAAPPQASPPRASSGLTQQTLEQKDWSFYADNEVLDKELELGRDLIHKATEKVTKEYLEGLGNNNDLNEADHDLVDILFRLMDLVSDGESAPGDWTANSGRLSNNANQLIHKMRNYPIIVQSTPIKGHNQIKDDFISASGNQGITVDAMESLREFLCEAFCMIDIVEELGAQGKGGENRGGNVNSLSAEKHRAREQQFQGERTSLPAFPSPAPDTSNIGIDSQFVSPIPNREGGQDFGGQSVNKYIDVSQEQTVNATQNVTHNQTQNQSKFSPGRKQGSPKRQHNLVVAAEQHEELNRSISPSRDLVKTIHRNERSS